MPPFFWYCSRLLLLGLGYRNLSEFLKILHKIKRSLAGACAGGLVTLYYLSVSILYENVDLFFDFCDKILHFVII